MLGLPWFLPISGISGIDGKAARMIPSFTNFTLPDWLPGWAALLIAVPFLLYALLFLLMPFSVFGVKAKLDALEAQIDALQDDLRTLSAARRLAPDDVPNFSIIKNRQREEVKEAETPRPIAKPSDWPVAKPTGRLEPRL